MQTHKENDLHGLIKMAAIFRTQSQYFFWPGTDGRKVVARAIKI